MAGVLHRASSNATLQFLSLVHDLLALGRIFMRCASLLIVLGILVPSYALAADPIGEIKNASGAVDVTRTGAAHHAGAGDKVFQDDVISTGADGTVGITFADNSLISLGPNSELKLDQFQFNPARSEEHTSNSSHMSISYAVFCLKKKNKREDVMI